MIRKLVFFIVSSPGKWNSCFVPVIRFFYHSTNPIFLKRKIRDFSFIVEGRQRKNSFFKRGKDKLIVKEASLVSGCLYHSR